MSLLKFLSLMLLYAATIRSVILLKRLRDWRFVFITLTLLVAVIPWTFDLIIRPVGLNFSRPITWGSVQQFLVNVMIVAIVFYLEWIFSSHKKSTAALIESEGKIRALFDNVPDAIVSINAAGKILYINRGQRGLTAEEMTGRTVFNYLPPDAQIEMREAIQKAFHVDQTTELDVPTVGSDGQQTGWFTCRIVPNVRDGQIPTATVIGTDITQRKLQEDDLRRAHDELEQRIAKRTAELARANDELRREIAERKQTEEQLSYRIEFERVISGISSRFIDLDPEQIDAAIADVLRTVSQFSRTEHSCICRLQGTPVQLSMAHEWCADGIEPSHQLIQNLPMDQFPWFWGKIRNLETVQISSPDKLSEEAIAFRSMLESRNIKSFIAVPLKTGHSAWGYLALAIESHHATWTDDTVALLQIVGEICLSALERKQANEALRATQARLHRLFQSNIIGSVYSNIHGTLHDANDTFLDMTGYTREDLPLNWEELSPPEWKEMDEAACDQLIVDGFTPPREKEYLHKDGHRVPILIGVALLSPGGDECVGFVLDLTERKKADQRLRDFTTKLESTSRVSVMGEMTAGLAHELHQPLAVIANYANGCVNWLKKESLDRDRLIQSLGEITDQSLRAAEILRRIRNFLHQRETQWQDVNMNTVIHDAIHLAELDHRHKDIKIVAHLENDLPNSFADGIQLTQVVLNLLLNGIHATTENRDGPQTLSVESKVNGQRRIQVTIADSGHGVPVKLRDKIFDQFVTTKPDGLGMGLAICKSTIEAHGGRLWMSPQPHGGTEFSFTIPAEQIGKTIPFSTEVTQPIPPVPK